MLLLMLVFIFGIVFTQAATEILVETSFATLILSEESEEQGRRM